MFRALAFSNVNAISMRNLAFAALKSSASENLKAITKQKEILEREWGWIRSSPEVVYQLRLRRSWLCLPAFSFSCTNPDGSSISADDVLVNGQIRLIFNRDLLFGGNYDGDLKSKVDSLSLRSPLRKLFVESASESDELEGIPTETHYEWYFCLQL
uniref:Uncharacterized protein n=1 Tax=Quercus lobata TaxID=97700 RepID=A0A7N2QX39_QUELO